MNEGVNVHVMLSAPGRRAAEAWRRDAFEASFCTARLRQRAFDCAQADIDHTIFKS